MLLVRRKKWARLVLIGQKEGNKQRTIGNKKGKIPKQQYFKIKCTQFFTTIQFLLSTPPQDTELPHQYCTDQNPQKYERINSHLVDAFLATDNEWNAIWRRISTFRGLKRNTSASYSTSWSTISTHRQESWLLWISLQSSYAGIRNLEHPECLKTWVRPKRVALRRIGWDKVDRLCELNEWF